MRGAPAHSTRRTVAEFFEALTHADGMRDKIEFSFIEFQGRPVAMHFGFVDTHKVYFYMPAMDRAFRQERVGAALLSAIVDHYARSRKVRLPARHGGLQGLVH